MLPILRSVAKLEKTKLTSYSQRPGDDGRDSGVVPVDGPSCLLDHCRNLHDRSKAEISNVPVILTQILRA